MSIAAAWKHKTQGHHANVAGQLLQTGNARVTRITREMSNGRKVTHPTHPIQSNYFSPTRKQVKLNSMATRNSVEHLKRRPAEK